MKDKAVYSNDRKAPRMKKGNFSYLVINKDSFNKFKEDYPEYSNMSYHSFYEYWLDIAEIMRDKTITNPLGLKLGAYTGELKFQYLPYKLETLDHNATEEYGAQIKNLNMNSRGKTGKIKWERRWAVKFNRMLQFYAFEPTRELVTLAKEYIKANPDKLRVSRVTLSKKT